MHWVARNGHSEVVAYLISKRAKVDITNDYGDTALHWAAFKGHKDVVTILLEKGANPFIKNKDGWLYLAAIIDLYLRMVVG